MNLLNILAAVLLQAYDSGDVTADEQLILEMINRARSNPTAEGTRLGISITEGLSGNEPANTVPQPPLAMNRFLLAAARAHCRDMYTRNFFAHSNPDGTDPFQRMTQSGYTWSSAAENIAVGSSTSVHTSNVLEDNLMVDSGVAGRGHRKALLDIGSGAGPATPRREIGIGFYQNPIANGSGWRSFVTQDFGRNGNGPFLVGVVYKDTVVADNFYTIGEGIPGVNIAITAGGSGTAVTSPGGGFVIPMPASGSITVTASGGPLNTTLSQTFTANGNNMRIEFKPTAGQVVDTDGDGLPDFYETANSLNPASAADAAQDPDGDGVSTLLEYQRGSSPTLAASTPISASGLTAPSFPYTIGGGTGTPSGGGGGGGGGGCGLTGLEGVLLLALLRRRRR